MGEWSRICTRPTVFTLAWASGRVLMSNTEHIMTLCNNSVNQIGLKAKIKRRGGKNGSSHISHLSPPMIIIIWIYVTDMVCRPRVQPSFLGEERRPDSRKRRKSSLLKGSCVNWENISDAWYIPGSITHNGCITSTSMYTRNSDGCLQDKLPDIRSKVCGIVLTR